MIERSADGSNAMTGAVPSNHRALDLVLSDSLEQAIARLRGTELFTLSSPPTRDSMMKMLQELCKLYMQDFDCVFQHFTDPIDLFCQQHRLQPQRVLLNRLEEFYRESLTETTSIDDLVKIGLEYVPGTERESQAMASCADLLARRRDRTSRRPWVYTDPVDARSGIPKPHMSGHV
jgi:hypothetical protein